MRNITSIGDGRVRVLLRDAYTWFEEDGGDLVDGVGCGKGREVAGLGIRDSRCLLVM